MKIKNIIIIIISLTIALLFTFYFACSNSFEIIASNIVDSKIKHILSDYKEYPNIDTSDILNIVKNSKEEIIYMSYNMNKLYALADNIINNIDYRNKELENSILLYIPLGTITNSLFLSSIGPKIPIGIKFINKTMAEVKTSVTNYGLNNALISIILEIHLSYKIITPVKYPEKDLSYEILLDTIVTQGTVPNWYNNLPTEKVFIEFKK